MNTRTSSKENLFDPWGKAGWCFIYSIAHGFSLNKTPIEIKTKQYKEFYESLKNVLPCFWCRQSYGPFFDSLDFDKYAKQKCGVTKFVYDLKELINNKLKIQEELALKKKFEKLSKNKDPKIWQKMRDFANVTCYTKNAPPFETVVKNLEKNRASCVKHLKSCSKPLLKSKSLRLSKRHINLSKKLSYNKRNYKNSRRKKSANEAIKRNKSRRRSFK